MMATLFIDLYYTLHIRMESVLIYKPMFPVSYFATSVIPSWTYRLKVCPLDIITWAHKALPT